MPENAFGVQVIFNNKLCLEVVLPFQLLVTKVVLSRRRRHRIKYLSVLFVKLQQNFLLIM